MNHDLNTSGEQRAFRFNTNKIQMSDININVSCESEDLADPNKWDDLTDPKVIDITTLSFSTTGSKCRNMSENFYWVVGDGATGLACEVGTKIESGCVDLNDLAELFSGCDITDTNVEPGWLTDESVTPPDPPKNYSLFAVNQIRIIMKAALRKDPTVLKTLTTSVKVANPWVGQVP